MQVISEFGARTGRVDDDVDLKRLLEVRIARHEIAPKVLNESPAVQQ